MLIRSVMILIFSVCLVIILNLIAHPAPALPSLTSGPAPDLQWSLDLARSVPARSVKTEKVRP